MSQFNFAGNATTTALIVPASCANTAAATSAAFDGLGYDGPVLVTQSKGLGTGSLDGKLQMSLDGSTGWTDTGVSFSQATTGAGLQTVAINPNGYQRYLRYVGTIVTGPQLLSVTVSGVKKYV
ncbi:hypothetical protein LNV08_07785 [Paucibacter sp. TC2R-5]|uniref:hypothetical protein n=1 Tax=Paucibacter sp. TC2R-5 TaxID=2893555 RepID=UPI0021E387C4|nr:hypothetical protein [Paucibacter sp. TC2R-5]MCV2358880.1 hypothetical protein [Paucibacter sp. TC2R-5]